MKGKNKKSSISVLTLALSASILANSVATVNANELNKTTSENIVGKENSIDKKEVLKNEIDSEKKENVESQGINKEASNEDTVSKKESVEAQNTQLKENVQNEKLGTTGFRQANFNVKGILPLDENGNLLISTENKKPINVKVINFDGTIEYKKAEGEFSYSPKGSDIRTKVDAVKSDFENIKYEDFYTILQPRESYIERSNIRLDFTKRNGRAPSEDELNAEVKRYYLDTLGMREAFDRVKKNLDERLYAIFEHSEYGTAEYVRENKNKIIVALTLLERQYNFKFGNIQAQNLILYYPEFFSFYTDPVDSLINIGSLTYEGAKLSGNVRTFTSKIARITNQRDIISLIEYALPKLENTDIDTWFKKQSKAIIVEAETKVGNSNLITKMRNSTKVKTHLIPLLTLTDDYLYVISTMKTINYGLVDTYVDRSNGNKDRTELIEKIKYTAKHQEKFFEFWHRITEKKADLLNLGDIFVVDTMKKLGPDSARAETLWSPKYGDQALGGVREFLTPLDLYTKYFFADGLANGQDKIELYLAKGLEDRGQAVYTHELTHMLDKTIWFDGNGRRKNKNAEVYARGFFESVNNQTFGEGDIFNLNTAYTLGNDRTQNKSPERFQNDEDLKEYMQGVLDVLYTLDYYEAKAILERTPEERTVLLNKVDLVPDSSKPGASNDNFTNITVEEAKKLNDINDFVDNKIVSGRYEFKGRDTVGEASSKLDYFTIPLFQPIYAALQNDTEATGVVTFRRNAYDILGEYGYTNGMSAYISGKYTNDRDALNSILDSKYNGNLAEFKKDMFKRRIEKVSKLRPTTKFKTPEELENLMKQAVEKDLARMQVNKVNRPTNPYFIFMTDGVTAIRDLKKQIFNEYLNMTNDFESSIYEEKPHNVTINFKYENNTVKTETLEINDGANVENIEAKIPTVADGTYKISDTFDKTKLSNIKSDTVIDIPLVKVTNALNLNTFNKNKIASIAVIDRPTKKVYNEGEKLDLTGIKIKIVDDKGIIKYIGKDDLEKYGITVSKNLDEALVTSDFIISFNVNGKSDFISIKVNALPKNEKFEPTVSGTTVSYKTDATDENARDLILANVTVDSNAGTVNKEIVGDIPKTEGNHKVKVKVTYDDATFDEVEVNVNVLPRDKVNYDVLIKYVFEGNSVFEKTINVVENTNVENIENYIPSVTDGTYKISENFDRTTLNNITSNKTIEVPLVKVTKGFVLLPFNMANIQKIEIVEMPEKVEYKEGEMLDLMGLKVKITDDKGISKVVEAKDFKTYGITLSKDITSPLAPTDNEVVLTVNGKTSKFDINVTENPKVAVKHRVTVKYMYEGAIVSEYTIEVEEGQNVEGVEGKIPTATDGTYKISENFDRTTLNNVTSDKAIEVPLVKMVKGMTLNMFSKDNIEKIEVVEMPIKVEYKSGEKLDLTGLKVKLIDKNGISKVVDLSEFKDYGITITPSLDTALQTSDNKVVLKVGSLNFEFTINVTEEKPQKHTMVPGNYPTEDPLPELVIPENPEKPSANNGNDKKQEQTNTNVIPKTAVSNNVFAYLSLALISMISAKLLNKKKDEI